MPSMAVLAVYIPLSMLTAVIFVIELFRRFKRQEDYLFTILCLCIAFWFACDIANLWLTNLVYMKFIYNVKIIFVGFVPPVLLLFVLRFYKVSLGPRALLIRFLLYFIPSINIFMALTSRLHSWMVDFEIVTLLPTPEYLTVWGPWFWVHTGFSYIVSVIIISVVVVRHFRLPRFYRLPSTLMGFGILLTLLGNIITLLQLLPPIFDPTLIACSLSMILFDLAIINNNKSKFVRFSHNHIFHYLDEYILILDDAHRVLEWNRPAGDWFSTQEIPLKESNLPAILDALLSKDGATQNTPENQKGSNIFLPNGNFPVVLNVCLHDITDAYDDIVGSVAVFSDITQTWSLIERLEEKAGVDSLTGIPNHRAYTGAIKRLNQPEHLPLSVIACDANNLKGVNDTLGHRYGDLMLKVVAGVLEAACSYGHFTARTGGDEFICLLPNTSREDALQKTVQIRETLSSMTQYPFPLSLAMGVATKCSPEEDLEELLAAADDRMYQDKKINKEQLEIQEIGCECPSAHDEVPH